MLPQLSPGTYKVSVTAPGFQTAVVEALTLNIAERSIVNISLKVGQVNEQVTVEASAPLLEQETASLGQVITQKTLIELPLNGRNYLTLGALSPGVIPQLPTGTGPPASSLQPRSAPTAVCWWAASAKARPAICYDGVEMRNPRIGDSSITPSLDAVQEFTIQRNFFQAEFGNSPGIINVASRSGSNAFHGQLFEFLRNDAMDARNFFSSQVEPFKRNQYGAAGGGFIKRDTLFFFGNFESFRQRLGSHSARYLPDSAVAQR